MLQTQLLHANESSLGTAEKRGTPKTEEKKYHKETANVHPERPPELARCASTLLPALVRETGADLASKMKAKRAGRIRKADTSQLASASTYYHPLNPLRN